MGFYQLKGLIMFLFVMSIQKYHIIYFGRNTSSRLFIEYVKIHSYPNFKLQKSKIYIKKLLGNMFNNQNVLIKVLICANVFQLI